MDIKTIELKNLIPYDKNLRKNDEAVKYVAASIREFGFKVPIVIDRNNVIVAGHTRYKAAQELGLKDVPCIIADDLTDEQVRAFRLADNKTAELAGWDFEILAEELEDICDISMASFGFESDDDMDKIIDKFFEDSESENNSRKKKHICPNCGYEFEE